jgi:hypothetical protein
MLEILQGYREEELQFISHLVAKEDDYAIHHATEAATRELISLGNREELWGLFNSMDENQG